MLSLPANCYDGDCKTAARQQTNRVLHILFRKYHERARHGDLATSADGASAMRAWQKAQYKGPCMPHGVAVPAGC